MDRLTRRELWWGSQGKTDKVINYKVDEERRCVTHEGSPDFLIADKLAEYEDLEEQGKLLKLSCAVGDTVYTLNTLPGGKTVIGEITADSFICALGMLEGRFAGMIFPTKEAAAAKLAEMEGKNGN